MQVEWSKRAAYIRQRHAIEPAWANEAVNDDHAAWLTPDPASRSGYTVRVVGYSPSAAALLTVILVGADADPDEPPDADWWGSNAWHCPRLSPVRRGRHMSKIDDLLAEEGAAGENYPLPEQVTAARPNLGRPTVVSVRLSANEHADLQRAATDANLPISTLIRIWALDRLNAERTGGTVGERLARLERHVFQDTV